MLAKPLPKKDYPVVDIFSFVSVWLESFMDTKYSENERYSRFRANDVQGK